MGGQKKKAKLRLPQGFQGTKEHGQIIIRNMGKENNAGNTRTKAVFLIFNLREHGTPKSKNR